MKISKKVIFIIVGILLLLIIVEVVLGIFTSLLFGICGTIAGHRCSEGYFCKMPESYFPDRSGQCYPDKFPFNLLK